MNPLAGRLSLAATVACLSATAAVYEIGPNQTLTSIGQAPWANLQPGDEVRIHWRAAPYREKWVIGGQGAPSAPITIRGVPGPQGEKPVVDGAGAVTAPGLNFWNEDRGVIKIGGSNIPSNLMPRYLVVAGLEIRGGNSSNTFTNDTGGVSSYRLNAAGVFIEKGEHITIRDCEITDNGNGIFVASSDSEPSRDILIQRNYIHGNSNVGRNREHNTYTAALGIVYEYNRFGPVKPGAGGAALKDRSSGTVIRYNWIEGGNRQLDLVEAEDSIQIRNDPAYRETYVYGNTLIEPDGAGNRQMVHYGGDNGDPSTYRKGVLYFFNNTLVSTRTDRNTLFRLSTNDEQADARNNIFYTTLPGADLSLLDSAGRLDLTNNWIKPGWRDSFDGGFSGVVTGSSTLIEGVSPGFMDEAIQDFRLAPGSSLVDAGAEQHPASSGVHDLVDRYIRHQEGTERTDAGALDIGAQPLRMSVLEAPVLSAAAVRANGDIDLAWRHYGVADGFIILRLTPDSPRWKWRVIGSTEAAGRSWRVPSPLPGLAAYIVMAYGAFDDTHALSPPSRLFWMQ